MSKVLQDPPELPGAGGNTGQSWQTLLRRLSGIRSVGVSLDTEGRLQQIKLLVEDDRDPRHLAREVASLLKVWTDQSIAPDSVEIIQLSETEERARVRIANYQEVPMGPLVRVEVDLAAGNLVERGSAAGPNLSHMRTRVAAEAAVNALNNRLGNPSLCSIGAAHEVSLGPQRAVIVLAYLQGQPYTGSALVHDGLVGEAAVKAALNALNRQFAWPQQQR